MNSYVSPTKAMEHQIEAYKRLGQRPSKPSPEDVMAWLMDRGTGKSKVILDEWQSRVDVDMDVLVVFAPAGSWKNWFEDKTEDQRSEMNTHLDKKLIKRMQWAAWKGGADGRRSREMLTYAHAKPRAFFINVEAFQVGSAKKMSKAEKYVRSLIDSVQRGIMLVIDESTAIRGESNRSEALIRLKEYAVRQGKVLKFKCARRIATGLVTPRSPMDLFYQFWFLDEKILGFESKVAFRNRYAIVEKKCFAPNELIRTRLANKYRVTKSMIDRQSREVMVRELDILQMIDGTTSLPDPTLRKMLHSHYSSDNVEGMGRFEMLEEAERLGVYVPVVPMIKGFKNLEELQKKIAPYSFRVLKDDCLDLKPKIYAPFRQIELTEEQERLYKELLKKSTAELEDGSFVVANVVIAKIMRLHQILCGHVRNEDGDLRIIKTNRVKTLMEVLDDHDGKAVIWSMFRHEIDEIVKAIVKDYGPEAVAQFHGGNVRMRDADERRFLGDPRCRFMVSTQATGGKGNTWTVADLAVYCSQDYDLEKRDQSEDRTHRKGQKKKVVYIDLVARGTVDEIIIRSLRKKIDMAAAITGENAREWLI